MINVNFSKYNLDNEQYLVVGVSAGPDSMALLHYCINNSSKKIVCAHVNHNIRKESDEEEKFLKKFCNDNNVIFENMKIDNYNDSNLENQARIKRYNFYKSILKKYNSHFIFLAHHGDDLIETVLMKISRGSNLDGYAGIKEINEIKNNDYNYYIIRPLLPFTKEDLINYNKSHNINYYIDKTNYSDHYTRNRYRKYVLPFLKNEDKNIHLKFLKFSNILNEYDSYINNYVKKIKNNIYNDDNSKLNIEKFKSLDPFIQKNLLYNILTNIYNNKDNIIKEIHLNNIIEIIYNKKNNISINLPKNVKVVKEYNNLIFKINNTSNNDYRIILKKHNVIGKYIIDVVNEECSDGNDICRLNSKNISLPIYIRNKKDGDIIEVLGLGGHKKVKDIFIEKKIPKDERGSYPIVTDSNDNILWLPNLKKSNFNVKKDDFYDIILKCNEKEK